MKDVYEVKFVQNLDEVSRLGILHQSQTNLHSDLWFYICLLRSYATNFFTF